MQAEDCVETVIRPGESYRVCVCVIRYNSNLPHLYWVAKRDDTKKEMEKEGNKQTNESHTEMSLFEREVFIDNRNRILKLVIS